MDDEGDPKNNKQIKKTRKQNPNLEGYVSNDSTILQSIWIRCRTIFPNITDREFMESELRFVLYCGSVFWSLYILFTFIK